MSSDKVLGIDLGTTNTAFAILEGGEPEMIPNAEGDLTMPSVVAFKQDDSRLVGQSAVNQSVQNPNRTIESIKRKMGREDYVEKIGDEEFKPEEISAIVLRKVKQDAEEYIGETINRAIITVPAYFTDRQRQATKNAGEIAGLEVERIINEPTAAAIAYGLDSNQDQIVLVADLGGGTFDVSILDLGGGVFDVEATNGERYLGGDDWDRMITDHLIHKFESKHSIDIRNSPEAFQRLKRGAEKAKKDLTTRFETQINIPFIATTDEGPIHLEETLTREKFEQITSGLRQNLTKPIEDAIKEANISRRNIDNVILVGGSTKMPQIQRHIEGIVNKQPLNSINPDEAVARGAAIQGGIVAGERDDVVLLDVTPMTVGIEIKGGLFEPLISKNETIPTRVSKLYTTSEDNQKNVIIKVYQGEESVASRNELLDEFKLEGIPRAEAGTPRITVEFKINANGILEVTAQDQKSGNAEGITISGTSGLSDEEIQEMTDRTKEYEEISTSEKERISVRNRADQVVSHARKILLEESAPIATETAIKMENKIGEIDELLEDEDATTADIKEATTDLENLIGRPDHEEKAALPFE